MKASKVTFGGVVMAAVLVGLYMLIFARENYSNGKIEGTVTNFKEQGSWFKTWEGHLNVTQTGMNSAQGMDFSIDRDNKPAGLVERIDSASRLGWKVELVYHEVRGYNWFENRGHTNVFVTECVVQDRNFSSNIVTNRQSPVQNTSDTGYKSVQQLPAIVFNGLKNRDTIYVININSPK